jgi:seryl-tRNA synthetase
MLDLKFIRENPDTVRQALEKRQDSAPLDDILRLDQERRRLLSEAEGLRAKRNEVSKNLSKMKQKPPEIIAEMRQVGDRIKAVETEEGQLSSKLNDLLLLVPNMPHSSVHLGKDSSDNITVRTWGDQRKFDFKPRPHWELGEQLGIIDFERGAKLSGSRFYILRGLGAQLQRAIITFMLDLHVSQHGYTEIYPPYMVKRECLVGSSNLPKFADNLYHDAEEDYWWVPTAEVPLTNLHRDEILEASVLPIYYVAYTACFRREKMSAGKDVRGIKRGHQFDKVELYKYTTPETSMDELEKMVDNAQEVARRLEIPHRIVQLCTADIGFASMKSYDIEMWAPGCEEWLEVSSCSNCGDFQSRRANIRYRPEPDAKPQFPHTLNGSGLALPRVLISVLENYQQADGSVLIPKALQRFIGGVEKIG